MQLLHPMRLLEMMAHRGPNGIRQVATLGGTRIWLVSNPRLVNEVLADDLAFNRKGVIYQALEGGEHGVLKEGLFTQKDSVRWAQEREVCNPFFDHSSLADTSLHIVERAQARASTWRNGEEVSLYKTLVADSLGTLSHHLLGSKIPHELTSEIAELGPAYFKKMAWQLLLSNYPRLGGLSGYEKAGEKFGEVLEQIIDMALQNRQEFTGTLLDALLEKFSPTTELQLIKGTLGTFYLAGFDSTAGVLAKALLYLVKNQIVQDQLRAEIQGVFGKSFIDPARIGELPIVKAYWEFALHQFTAFQVIFRNVSQDYALGNVELKEDDQILLGLHAMHTNPKHRSAKILTPDDFLRARKAATRPPHKPFGAHNRKCIGAPLANAQGVLTLAVWLQEVEFYGRPWPNLGTWLGVSMTSHPLDSRVLVRHIG